MKIDLGNFFWFALLALFMALVLWGSAQTAKRSDVCYQACFPYVGQVIDKKCHCAYSDREWTLYAPPSSGPAVQ